MREDPCPLLRLCMLALSLVPQLPVSHLPGASGGKANQARLPGAHRAPTCAHKFVWLPFVLQACVAESYEVISALQFQFPPLIPSRHCLSSALCVYNAFIGLPHAGKCIIYVGTEKLSP